MEKIMLSLLGLMVFYSILMFVRLFRFPIALNILSKTYRKTMHLSFANWEKTFPVSQEVFNKQKQLIDDWCDCRMKLIYDDLLVFKITDGFRFYRPIYSKSNIEYISNALTVEDFSSIKS